MDISTATTFASGLVGLIVPAFVQAFKKYIPSGYVGLVSLAASILFGTIAIAATGGFDGTCTWGVVLAGVVLAGVVGVSQTVYTLVKAFDGKLEFDIEIFPYTGNSGWVEDALLKARDCLESDTIPDSDPTCELCTYRQESRKVEQ